MLGLRAVRVCDVCIRRVSEQVQSPEELCHRCGDALGMESARFAASLGMRECTGCRLQPPSFARAVAFGPYDNELREMLHALKFSGVRRVGDHVLGPWIAAALLGLEAEAARTLLVVPVPLFRERQRERGYNQAELLARSALRQMRRLRPDWTLELCTDVLLRVRDTKAMFQLRPDQRRRNLQGAFRVSREEAVRGREVLLIDDILTTGATANQCAKALLKAGATKVWVATVARAQPESRLAVTTDVAVWDALPSSDAFASSNGLARSNELKAWARVSP